jgi:CRP-like cAMP-binding protein
MSINHEAAILREIAPFAILDTKKLKLLAFMSKLVVYDAGEVVLRQGDKGDALFVLVEGAIEIFISTPGARPLVCEMGRHTFFGEIAVMRSSVRAATVTAKTNIAVLRISKEVLYEVIDDEPELGRLIAEHIDKSGYTIPE